MSNHTSTVWSNATTKPPLHHNHSDKGKTEASPAKAVKYRSLQAETDDLELVN